MNEDNNGASKANLNILLCPYCNKELTSIKLLYDDNRTISIKMTCQCLPKAKILNLEDFIERLQHRNSNDTQSHQIDSSKFLFIDVYHKQSLQTYLFDNTINVHCITHKSPYSFYCQECNHDQCLTCKKSHAPSHTLIPIDKFTFDSYSKDYENIPYFLDQIKRIKDDFITKAHSEIIKEQAKTEEEYKGYSIEQINTWQKDIEFSYEINRRNNSLLQVLALYLYHIAILLQAYPTRSLIKLFKSFQFKGYLPIVSSLNEDIDIHRSYETVKHHLLNEMIIVQKSSYQCTSTIENHTSFIWALCELHDHKIASGAHDKTIHILNPTTLNLHATLKGHKGSIRTIIQLRGRKGLLVSSADDRILKFWNVTTAQCLLTVIAHFDWVEHLLELHDGQLASCSYDKSIKVWDVNRMTCNSKLMGHTGPVACMIQLTNMKLVSGSQDNSIIIWNMTSRVAENRLTGHTHWINCLVQLTENTIASASYDNSVKLWDVKALTCYATLNGHTEAVLSVVKLFDGQLASCSGDKHIKLWDLQEYTCTNTLKGHDSSVLCMINLSNHRIISGSGDKRLKIWSPID